MEADQLAKPVSFVLFQKNPGNLALVWLALA
jgi:hypothetical protein